MSTTWKHQSRVLPNGGGNANMNEPEPVKDDIIEMMEKEWLMEQIMCDEWGRPPSLADVPLTIMTRKEALIKQGGNDKSIDKLYKETMNVKKK